MVKLNSNCDKTQKGIFCQNSKDQVSTTQKLEILTKLKNSTFDNLIKKNCQSQKLKMWQL